MLRLIKEAGKCRLHVGWDFEKYLTRVSLDLYSYLKIGNVQGFMFLFRLDFILERHLNIGIDKHLELISKSSHQSSFQHKACRNIFAI